MSVHNKKSEIEYGQVISTCAVINTYFIRFQFLVYENKEMVRISIFKAWAESSDQNRFFLNFFPYTDDF